MRFTGLIVFVCVAFASWQLITDRSVARAPGILVEDGPKQVDLQGAQSISHKNAKLTPRAEFKAEVRVLSLERYRVGQLADVVPIDVAVGWGEMSDSAVL